MEKMINRRLIGFLNVNGLLDTRQHAFRPGQGTNTYLRTLGQALYEAREGGHHAEIAALDLSKAYNRAWMPAVIEQLAKWNIKGHTLHFIHGFLSHRTFQVIIGNNKSRVFDEETGVPQGSVLAVTLFLVRMNSVFDQLPMNIRIFVYADDIVILVVGATIKAIRRKLTQAVKHIAKWADSAGFELSAAKSTYTHICGGNHRINNAPLDTGNGTVPRKTTVKILGVTVDRKLTFIPHINTVKEGCKSRINLLKLLGSQHTRTNRYSRLGVSKAIVDSRLTYGLELTALNSHHQTRTGLPARH